MPRPPLHSEAPLASDAGPLTISVVVPVVNEQARVGACVTALRAGQAAARDTGRAQVVEIVVVDGGSDDATVEVARAAGAHVVASPVASRAAQMNLGARETTGEVLYFVHGDALVPSTYADDIAAALGRAPRTPGGERAAVGGYRTRFDRRLSPLLRFNEWMTRFPWAFCRGGDQTLFVPRRLFDRLGGYDPAWTIMEEYDFLDRARRLVPYVVLPGEVVVSSRKYQTNSWLCVQLANAAAYRGYRRGESAEVLRVRYGEMLKPYTA